jgi:hypothetical protein
MWCGAIVVCLTFSTYSPEIRNTNGCAYFPLICASVLILCAMFSSTIVNVADLVEDTEDHYYVENV